MLTRDLCPLCNSSQYSLFRKGTIDPHKLAADDFKITDQKYGSLWTFFRCRNCGFIFSNPTPSKEAVLDFYSRLEDREYEEEAQGRQKNFIPIIKHIKSLAPEADSILDIGAASGIFLDLAASSGFFASGIEPSEQLCHLAREHYGLELYHGSIETYQSDRRFDVVTLLDIIEHLVAPETILATVDKVIRKNGLLIIVTPDISSLACKLLGKRWWHFRTAHLNFFNQNSIRYLLGKHQYEIVKKKRYAWNFSLLYLLTRIRPEIGENSTLQKHLKRLHLKLQLFDSWEIYARKI